MILIYIYIKCKRMRFFRSSQKLSRPGRSGACTATIITIAGRCCLITGACFLCGSTEHQLKGCSLRHFIKGTCYHCAAVGHQIKECPFLIRIPVARRARLQSLPRLRSDAACMTPTIVQGRKRQEFLELYDDLGWRMMYQQVSVSVGMMVCNV